MRILLTGLRILVGWHFLYEGIAKLAIPGWSSYSYLMKSQWLFSGIFHKIIADPSILSIIDFLNIWGLILIGAGLFLGLFTRITSILGILLLMMYYVANPPFIPGGFAEGHYFIIDKNLIEAAVLVVLASVPQSYMWGFDRLFNGYFHLKKEKKFPDEINHDLLEGKPNSRRELIKNLATLPIMGGAFWGMAQKSGWLSFEEEGLKKTDAITSASILTSSDVDLSKLLAKAPRGKIGNLEISRLIPGGNLVAGIAHARDLVYVSRFIKSYFTDEKIIETFWLYEACGINTVLMRTDEQVLRVLKEFWRRGGKLQWLAQVMRKPGDDLTNAKLAIDSGASGALVFGNYADKVVYQDRMDLLAKPVEFIKSQGLIAGVAAHAISVPKRCIDYGIVPDFFMKTLHHDKYWSATPKETRPEYIVGEGWHQDHNKLHDNIWCVDAEETIKFFSKSDIPLIGFKTLAAGAIKPKDGFKYAFENGADFACVGMFDFQVIENVNIVNDLLNGDLKRKRQWYT